MRALSQEGVRGEKERQGGASTEQGSGENRNRLQGSAPDPALASMHTNPIVHNPIVHSLVHNPVVQNPLVNNPLVHNTVVHNRIVNNPVVHNL